MRLLICTPYLPWPLDSGGKASQYAVLSALPQDYEIRIIYRQKTPEDIANAKEIEKRLHNVKIVIVERLPQASPNPPINPIKVNRLYEFIQKVGYKLYFTCLKMKSHLSRRRDSMRPTVDTQIQTVPWFPHLPIETSIITAIQQNHEWADIIQFEFHDYMSAGCLPINDKPTVFVSHQVHAMYIQSWFASRTSYLNTWIPAYYEELTRESESYLLSQFSKVVVFCHEDAKLLANLGVSSSVEVSPFPFPDEHNPIIPRDLQTSDWKQELVFLGSGSHGPNLDGLTWFFKKVYPLIISKIKPGQSSPRVYVAGHWNEKEMAQFEIYGPVFYGYVDDIGSVLKGRISISPIQIGSGIRTKLLSAAVSASPIVSTSLGCQGLGFMHEEHCLIGDSAEKFSSEVLRLLNSPTEFRCALSSNAASHVINAFSRETVGSKRSMIYESLLSNS